MDRIRRMHHVQNRQMERSVGDTTLEWRVQWRQLVQGEQLLTLLPLECELAEAKRRGEEWLAQVKDRLARLEITVVAFAQVQTRTERSV